MSPRLLFALASLLLVAALFPAGHVAPLCAAEPAPVAADEKSDLFTRRILPIARSQKASSCTECHFAGVDLKQYVLDDEAGTFAALRAAGLVDVRQPRNSKLLQFIARKPEREDPLFARVRAEESAAFTAWIEAAVRNPSLLAAQPPSTPIGADLPLEVVRHARRDQVLQSFVENIWVETERCVNCHSPERNQRQVKEHGQRVSWLSPRDPAGTLAQCIEQGIIDVDAPEKSMLLTKPLGIVEHGGHIKFVPGSRTDQQFRRFLNDYAAVVNGKYRTAAEFPKDSDRVILATGQQLRVTDLPLEYGGRLMRVLLHRREADGWSKLPVATADSGINPKNGQWQNPVFAFLDRNDPAAKRLTETRLLPGERYLARLYIDRQGHAADSRLSGSLPLVALREVAGDFNLKLPKNKQNAAAPKNPGEMINVVLRSHPNGDLAAVQIDDKPPTPYGAATFAELQKFVATKVSDAQAAGRDAPEIQIDSEDHLRYEYIIKTVEAVSATTDEAGKYKQLAKKVKFAPRQEAHNSGFEFGPGDLFAEIEFSGDWKPGYLPPKIISVKERK